MASMMQSSCARLATRRCHAGLNARPSVQLRPLSGAAGRRTAIAGATVKDPVSGAEFQLAQQFWEGDVMRCMGAVTRNKKIVFVNVQVYSAAVYVEADKCAKELGVRQRGGFFETDADFCQAILDGAFHKVIVIRLLRDVDGAMFADAISKYLVPKMELTGDMPALDKFIALFDDKKLTNGTEVVLLCNVGGDLEVLVAPSAASSYSSPELKISSTALSRGMFEIFLGEEQVVAGGHEAWAAGAKNLLESDNVKRGLDS